MPMTLPPVKAILFDLDGLLADTEPLQKRAFEEVCRRYAGREFAISDALHATFVGKSDHENARDVIERYGLDVSSERLIEERMDIYVDILRNSPVPAGDGIDELLDAARAVGLRLGVASSSIRRFVDVSLERVFETMDYPVPPAMVFGAIVCGDDPRIGARKPAPDIYEQCARDLRVDPAECLALEDSASGIESARRAGIHRAVAIPNVYTREHDFSRAYCVLESARDAIAFFSS